MLRLHVVDPQIQFMGRVNQATINYPIDQVEWDSLQQGSIGQTSDGQMVLFGTAAGLDDKGRQRLRKAVDADTVYFGRSSQGTNDGEVDLEDGDFITVLWSYPPFAKIPFIDDDGNLFKDSDFAVGDNTTNPPPVANCGPPMAGTIDEGTSKLRVQLPPDSNTSFATADGATITGYQWFLPSGVTLVGGFADTDSQIQVDCDPGFYYVRLRVTDSNGKTHEARTAIYARDPAADTTVQTWQIENHVIRPEGQSMDIRIFNDLDEGVYIDGTMVLVWEDEPSGPADRSHMRFWGWHQTDPAQIQAQRLGARQSTVLNCLDVGLRMASMPTFPQALQNDDFRNTEKVTSITWNYMTDPTINKYLHYLIYWHTTVLELADWTWAADGDNYPFIVLESTGSNLYDQVDSKCKAMVPDHRLTCNRLGQLAVLPDPFIQDVVDRTLTVQATFDTSEVEEFRWTHQRPPRVHWLKEEAVGASATKDANGDIITYFSRAPGDASGQGDRERRHGRQLAKSQSDLNASCGNRYARMNARQTLFDVVLSARDNPTIEPADMTWVRFTIDAAVAAQRRLTFANERGLVQEMSISYRQRREGLSRVTRLRWERETSGNPGVTWIPPAIEEVDDGNNITPPPEFGTGELDNGLVASGEQVALVSGNKIYTTSDFQTTSAAGGPTWAETVLTTDASTHYGFVVDPFSPGYIGTGTAINGWIVTETNVYYVDDMFAATPTVTNQHTFTTTFTTALAALRGVRVIDASFGRFFDGDFAWVGVYSYYADETGHTGSWLVYSQDGGATWSSEVQISAHYDTDNGFGQNPPIYLSPKSPGLAYAMAFTATGSHPAADGYISNDWGDTWSRIGNPDIQPGVRLAGGLHVPWRNNSGEDLIYHCYNDATTGDPNTTSSFRTKRVDGATITDISPIVSSRHYGPRFNKFGIRTYDSNRRYVAMVGLSDTNPDTHAAFVSIDYGDTWTVIVSPDDTDPLPREIAFAGDDRNVLYIWGQGGYISYSNDFGTTVDDRKGNLLTSFSPGVIQGIAGGPLT